MFSYEQLIRGVNTIEVVSTAYRASDYRDFVINTIAALVHGIDIQLVDYRNTVGEVQEEITKVNDKNLSVSSLIHSVKESRSKVGIFSSGTEGNPKLVYQPVSRLLKSVRIDDIYTGSVWGFAYNPSHSAGIQMLLQVLCNRASLVDLYKCGRSKILDLFSAHRINYLSATPTFYRMLAPYDFRFESVRSITFNGEKSTKELINIVQQCFPNARVRNIYGSTEAGPLMSSETTTFKIPSRLDGKMKIEEGQLLLHNSLISKSINEKEWYPTGDLVEMVNADPLTIKFVSRKSRVLNVGGQNVNPQEIEELLLRHSKVKDVRVFGRKNRMVGNVLSAEVELMEECMEKELMDYCKEQLANYKVPRIINFVDKIKTGRTGKKSV